MIPTKPSSCVLRKLSKRYINSNVFVEELQLKMDLFLKVKAFGLSFPLSLSRILSFFSFYPPKTFSFYTPKTFTFYPPKTFTFYPPKTFSFYPPNTFSF